MIPYLAGPLHQAESVIIDWSGRFCHLTIFALAAYGTAFTSTPTRTAASSRNGRLYLNYARSEVRNFLVANRCIGGGACTPTAAVTRRLDALSDYSREEGEWTPNEYAAGENLERCVPAGGQCDVYPGSRWS